MRRMMIAGCLLAGCQGDTGGNDIITTPGDTATGDNDGPEITADPITDPQAYDEDILIEARATDPAGVLTMQVFYQDETAGDSWKQKQMTLVGSDLFQGTIPGEDVKSGSMRYYLQAVDTYGNTACLPTDCAAAAWDFPVSAF